VHHRGLATQSREDLAPDERVRTLHIVLDRLADVVEERRLPCQLLVTADLRRIGHELGATARQAAG